VRGLLLRWLPVFPLVFVAMSASQSAPHAAPAANIWVNVTANLANMASDCGNLTLLSAVPRSDTVLAAVGLKGLWSNTRGSNTWVHLGSTTANKITHPSSIVYDPAHPGVFWESAIYGGGGVYQTSDNGNTFRQLGSITHNDYVSVNFRDPERQTLLAGGHEQSQTVYQSFDSGRNWTNVGLNLPANTGYTTFPLILNSVTYLVNAQAISNRVGGIFRTTNGGESWRRVSDQGPSGPPLVTANRTIYWPANGGLLKSTDAGSTWTQVGSDLRPISPIELSDGKLVAVGTTNLVISADGGATWSPFGAALPYSPTGLVYSTGRRSFLIWRSDCGAVVPADAIMEIQ
jgi:photosystem II stability/assembly factor-like uncharacterized protein